ncbi:DUF2247 family protein [Nocardia sp. NBC_01730]|uniref:DUF2247 family protein n=1 Tax=Nocardia sp. NBC_01730 TaxID=2975998 RepID=UPI002E145DC7|nr:DUF2247 family protein [Nocardia sp. NBC_01730]
MKFSIPASFVSEWAKLTPGELRFGHENEWLTSKDVVELALTSVVPPSTKMGVIEEISLLLSDELYRLPALMDKLADHDDRVWAYLALAWVHENQSEFDEPFKVVDMIFADFGYPEDVGEFVTFMPPPVGSLPGMLGLKQRWQRYLDEKRSYYMNRVPSGGANGS